MVSWSCRWDVTKLGVRVPHVRRRLESKGFWFCIEIGLNGSLNANGRGRKEMTKSVHKSRLPTVCQLQCIYRFRLSEASIFRQPWVSWQLPPAMKYFRIIVHPPTYFQGKEMSGRAYPLFLLCDWLAQCCRALLGNRTEILR